MGNDQDAARWIRQFRVAPPDGEAGGRRVNRRRGERPRTGPATASRPTSRASTSRARRPGVPLTRGDAPTAPRPPVTTRGDRRTRSHLHARPGGAAACPSGTTVLDAARSLGVDIDCGLRRAAGSAAAARSRRHSGRSPKHGITSAPDHLSRARRGRGGLSRRARPGRRPPAVVHGHAARRRRHRRPAREPGPPPGRAQGPRGAGLRDGSGRAPAHGRRHATRPRHADRRPRPAVRRRSRAEWGLDDLRADLAVVRGAPGRR